MIQYTSASEYYKRIFKCKVYKISIDAGCTCPNRDGTKGFGGCIFCSESGSGEFTQSRDLSITEQIENGKILVEKKLFGRRGKQIENDSGEAEPKYLAYFQNYTNTYGNVDDLKQKYLESLCVKNIVGLVIATRPDCISDDILQVINEISKTTYVSIELGLQTSNEKTAELINRQYELSVYDEALQRIHKVNDKIHVVTHLILGLPYEKEEDMINSVKHCLLQKTDGFKFTVLYIIKNTKMEQLWKKGEVQCLTQEEYFSILIKLLKIIPSSVIIHRLTGDGAKKTLLSPLWTANKRKVLNNLSTILRKS